MPVRTGPQLLQQIRLLGAHTIQQGAAIGLHLQLDRFGGRQCVLAHIPRKGKRSASIRSGMVTMKITSKTSITSTSGVMLIPAMAPC